jgi:hypothetical protein
MGVFFRSLFSGDETVVDSIVVAALLALVALIGVTVYVAIIAPAGWNPVSYASAAASLIGAGAGGKMARDRWSQPPGQPGAPK